MDEKIRCPKCGFPSGDDWSQCHGSCPMEGSPFYLHDPHRQSLLEAGDKLHSTDNGICQEAGGECCEDLGGDPSEPASGASAEQSAAPSTEEASQVILGLPIEDRYQYRPQPGWDTLLATHAKHLARRETPGQELDIRVAEPPAFGRSYYLVHVIGRTDRWWSVRVPLLQVLWAVGIDTHRQRRD